MKLHSARILPMTGICAALLGRDFRRGDEIGPAAGEEAVIVAKEHAKAFIERAQQTADVVGADLV